MMKIAAVVFSMLFASACCTSLPDQAPKRVMTLASLPSGHAVVESSAVWRDERRSRDVPVHIYAPAGSDRKWPVVVFSHGIGEDRDSYSYAGRALAQNGFLAVHVTHAGTDKAVLKRGYLKLYRATKDPENWRNRPLDISFVIDQIGKRDDADMTRIAVAGHSAGAFTAFAVAGVRAATGDILRDDRVRVIVALSMPKIPDLSYDDISVPVLNITGTCDSSIIYRTKPADRRVPFDRTHAANQYLVTIDRVNHNTFSNATDPKHELIMQLTISFLNAWMLDDATARAWFDDPGRGNDLVLERK